MKQLFFGVALLFSVGAQAQSWHFGPKLDANFSAIKGNGMRNKYTSGVQIGGFVEYQFNKTWSLQPELLYNLSRYKKAGDFMTYYNNYGRSAAGDNINLAYISVPVLLRYNLNKTLSFLAGPQYSYKIWNDEDLLKENREAFTNSEFSANVGVQANVDNVGFYARFNKGLNDINDVDERYSWKSSHIQIGIAVKIK